MFEDIDAIPEANRMFQGEQVKKQIVSEQQARKNQILQVAEQQRQEFNSKLAESTRDIQKLFPKETFGVDLTAQHSEYFYKGISSRELVKKHLGNIDEATLSRLDPNKLLATIAKAEMARELTEYSYSRGAVETKREILKRGQNVQIETPAIPARPDVAGDKPVTPEQKLKNYYSSLNQPGRL
jgi:hypothetical protein